jgi:hypothetical protein
MNLIINAGDTSSMRKYLIILSFAICLPAHAPSQEKTPETRPVTHAVAVFRDAEGQPGGPRVFLMDAGRLSDLKKELTRHDTAAIALVKRLCEQADKLLSMRPISVMDKSATPASGSKHDYMSQAPYFWYDSTKPKGLPYLRRDGQRNPEIYSITDRSGLDDVDNASRILGLAWWLTGEEKYAQKASILLKRWFLDDSTRMNPNLDYGQAIPGVTNGRGIGIIETISLMGIADASGLLEGSAGWTTADAEALRHWYAKYLDWMLISWNGREEHLQRNNHGIWYLAQAIDFALFAGNLGEAKALAEEGKGKMDDQIQADGKMPEELARTNGLGYSTYNLQALFALATAARLAGVDLWNYKNKAGADIRAAFDWLRPYALGKLKWEYQQISPYNTAEFVALLLQASRVYSDGKYDAEAKGAGTGGAKARQQILLYFSFVD